MAVKKTHAGITAALGKMVTALEQHIVAHNKEIEVQDAAIAKANEAKEISNKEITASTNTATKLREIIG